MKSFTDFLNELSSRATINGYVCSMIAFLFAVRKIERPDRMFTTEERNEYIRQIDELLMEKRNFFVDLIAYKKTIEQLAPRTQRSYLYSVKNVLEICCDINFSKSQTKNFQNSLLKGTRKPITQTESLTPDMIRSIVSFANIPTKAAVLIMATSGIRIGELVQLEMKHFDLNKRRILIPAHFAKTREQRFTYFTPEARTALEMWINYRPQYMKDIQKQCVHFKPTYKTSEQRMFPMSTSSLRENVEIAVKNAGLLNKDDNTRRNTILPHSFRKWFSTTASLHFGVNPTEILMGHELPYSGAYVTLTPDQIEQIYKKNETHLFIGSDEAVRNTLTEVSTDMDRLTRENMVLRKDIADMKKMMSEMLIQRMVMEEKPLPRVIGEENIKISS